jgi:sugar lactone lactonase YvrE
MSVKRILLFYNKSTAPCNYCCDADNHKFYGIKQDGTILFSFSSSEFRGPTCVAAAANGNLYVTAYQSHNVHCFTPDGKHKCHFFPGNSQWIL